MTQNGIAEQQFSSDADINENKHNGTRPEQEHLSVQYFWDAAASSQQPAANTHTKREESLKCYDDGGQRVHALLSFV